MGSDGVGGCVGVDKGVGDGVGEGVGAGATVAVGEGVAVGADAEVGAGVCVGVGEAVGGGGIVGVGAGARVGDGEGVAVGVGVGVEPPLQPTTRMAATITPTAASIINRLRNFDSTPLKATQAILAARFYHPHCSPYHSEAPRRISPAQPYPTWSWNQMVGRGWDGGVLLLPFLPP